MDVGLWHALRVWGRWFGDLGEQKVERWLRRPLVFLRCRVALLYRRSGSRGFFTCAISPDSLSAMQYLDVGPMEAVEVLPVLRRRT